MDEMCCLSIGAVGNGGWRWWIHVEFVVRACEQLKRGLEVVALCEMCFEGMGAVEKGDGGGGTR